MSETTYKTKILLSINKLIIKFKLRGKVLTAIRNLSINLFEGECLALVGESGSGKSVLSKSLLGILDSNGWIDSGEIIYKGLNLHTFKSEREWLQIRGKEIAMVSQDPMTSLNPLKTIGSQILEAVELHQGVKGQNAKEIAIKILKDVGIPDAEIRYHAFPHEFSGGMRQRVVIAIAIACKPKILICDEPTTALDVTIQAQILQLLTSLKVKYKLSILYITHDFGVVANIADRIAVMYAGDIVEFGLVDEIFFNPKHPYTWALLSSLPQLGLKGKELYSIKGTPPNLFREIKGDAFAPRNPSALKIDFEITPPYFRVTETHFAKTWLLDSRAPKISPPPIIQNLVHEEGE